LNALPTPLRRAASLAALTSAMLLAGPALAQGTSAAAATAAKPAAPAAKPAAPSSPAKKALVNRLLAVQMAGIEGSARQLAEQPAAQMLQQAGNALQRLPADKREALWREIQGDARKYAEDAGALAKERASKLAPTTIGALLEERFSEDELKQLVTLLESPAYKKLSGMGAELNRSMVEKLVPELRPTLEPKLKALEQAIVKRLEAASAAANASAPAAGASRP
jgi:hypothetical protein